MLGVRAPSAFATHLTETGTGVGSASVPWGFHEAWGFRANVWNAPLASAQAQRAGAITPATSASHFTVQWDWVERRPGEYDWSIPDGTYAEMRANSLEPVMMIFNAPEWARDPDASCPSERACAYPPAPEHDAAWRAFVEAAVERYPRVVGIEVWNEPNLGRFWAPAPDPARYVELLDGAHEAVAAAGSSAPVIIGGLVPTSNSATSMAPSAFLEYVYSLGGAGSFEGIGSHPYSREHPLVETMWNRIENLTDVRAGYRDTAPVWITEIGVPSDPTEATNVNAEEQGDVLVRLYRSTEGHGIASFIIYRLIDDPGDAELGFFTRMGVLDANLVPKPAYCELAGAIGTVCLEFTPPETTVESGPSGTVPSRAVSFSFSSNEPGSSFECRLDGGGLERCTAPRSYAGLSNGPHTFEVVATDPAGNTDATPAARSFTVDATPPKTMLRSGPGTEKALGSASFGFASSERGSFECRFGASEWGACSSPRSYSGLPVGAHRFSVRAIDAAGNVDPSPAARSWSLRRPRAVALGAGKRMRGGSAQLAADDDGHYAVRSTKRRAHVASWYATFRQVPNSLRELTVAYQAESSRGCRQRLWIRRWPASRWVPLRPRPVGKRKAAMDLGPRGAPENYVKGTSGDHKLQVRVRCQRRSSSFRLRTDLLRIAYDH